MNNLKQYAEYALASAVWLLLVCIAVILLKMGNVEAVTCGFLTLALCGYTIVAIALDGWDF
nr:MAG TPA: hypothetical protein [Caudoviricetes sp.]